MVDDVDFKSTGVLQFALEPSWLFQVISLGSTSIITSGGVSGVILSITDMDRLGIDHSVHVAGI